jgi:alpha-ketoglutarate-dependent taurine dioxygenase
MAIRIEPLDATLGATVTGLRIASLLTDPGSEAWRVLHDAFLEHALLILPAQCLEPDEQVAFARHFGEIEHLYGDSGFVPISNQRHDGSLLEDENPAMQIMIGNEGWHTDSSYMPLAAKASVLSAHVVPGAGGQTEWADMRAAYAELAPDLQQRISSLSARHSLKYSQAKIGHTDAGPMTYGFQDGEPPLRPLVKVHPETGRPSLFIGRHAHAIPGLPAADSEKLLDELLDFACRPPRTWQHDWQPGDLAIWDNRCVLHRARPYDHGEARKMVHTRIAGDPASEQATASVAS